ncbi:hypothetical protein R6Q57_013162 [Mikania cordata]
MKEMFIMKTNKTEFLEDDEQGAVTRRNNSSNGAYKWKTTIISNRFSRYDKTVPPCHCPTVVPLTKLYPHHSTKKAKRLGELGEEDEKLKRTIEALGKREAKPVDLEDSIESLTKRLDSLEISGKPSASNKIGQIYVFKDPHKIYKEEYEKQKKK